MLFCVIYFQITTHLYQHGSDEPEFIYFFKLKKILFYVCHCRSDIMCDYLGSKYVTQRLKMSPFSKKTIVHFIGFLNRAHQNEKSDILHVPIFKVFAEI